MSGSVVRSVSFPIDDLADVQELADEYGGLSNLFRFMYNALRDHRLATGTDPRPSELAAIIHERKAALEAKNEALARVRRERSEARAGEARARVARIQAPKVAANPTPTPQEERAPDPLTLADQIDAAAAWAKRARRQGSPQDVERTLRREAAALGVDPGEYVAHVMRIVNGQTDLRVLPDPAGGVG